MIGRSPTPSRNEHEGFLIAALHRASDRFTKLLDGLTVERLPEVRAAVATEAGEIHAVIGRLTALRSRILGLSGSAGLIELVAADDRKVAIDTFTIGEMRMGDTYHVAGAGAVGPGAIAHDIVINRQWKVVAAGLDLDELAQELVWLRAELRNRATEPSHDFASPRWPPRKSPRKARTDRRWSRIWHRPASGSWTLQRR